MDIVLIKSYTEKPWRSPKTYQLIEKSLKKKWRVKSMHTKNPETLHSFLPEVAKNIHVLEYEQLILKLTEISMYGQKNGRKMKH